MEEFCKCNWDHLRTIYLNDCKIDDNGWKIFVKNAKKFGRLEKIGIGKNLVYFSQQSNKEHQSKRLKGIRKFKINLVLHV